MIELSTDKNEIKTISFKVTEQEFRIIQVKSLSKITKRKIQIFFPKNSDVLTAASNSGSSKNETKNVENDIESEADIKSKSYSSTSALNTPYFSLQDLEFSSDYIKTLTEQTEINANENFENNNMMLQKV